MAGQLSEQQQQQAGMPPAGAVPSVALSPSVAASLPAAAPGAPGGPHAVLTAVPPPAVSSSAAAVIQAGGPAATAGVPPVSGAGPQVAAGSLPLSIGLASLPPGHPALAHIQQQMQAAMQAQQNVNVAQAMVQAAAQAAAAGVALPPGLQAQLQAQQQYQQVAAAAAAAAAVQQSAGVAPPQPSPAVVASAPQPGSAPTPSAAANAAAVAAAAASASQVAAASSQPQAQEQLVAVGENEWAAEPLFGGAMEMELPLRFKDISKYRPVPDHQEVFADGHQDQSLVVEILEMAQVDDKHSAHYFFEDLSVQNEAEASALETVYTLSPADVPNLPSNCVCTCALGYQTVAKGRQSSETSNYVQIIFGVVRLPEVQSDIVISLNTPAYINEKSSSAEHAGAGPKTAYLRAPEAFRRMLQSFRIMDMGLFGST